MLILLLENYRSSLSTERSIKIEKGNPQGSRISPTLFLIYINEIIEKIDKLLIDEDEIALAYADDLVILAKGEK